VSREVPTERLNERKRVFLASWVGSNVIATLFPGLFPPLPPSREKPWERG